MSSIIYRCLAMLLLLWQLPLIGQEVTATLTSEDDEVCLGDSVAAYIVMTGQSPWIVVINNNLGEYLTLKEVKSPYIIWLKPEADDNYYISSVVDSLGVEGTPNGNVQITVKPVTPVEILLDRTAYLKSEPGVQLRSDPVGAVFFGYGVVNGKFYPGIATPSGSPYDISCIYTNELGCKSNDTVVVDVIHGEAEVALYNGNDPIQTVCDDQITYEIRGSNLDSQEGSFRLMEGDESGYLDGYIVDDDSTDNIAALNTAGLAGTYILEYSYSFDVLTVMATELIQVNDLKNIVIEGLPEIICSGNGPYQISPGNVVEDPGAVYAFSGPGVSGSQSDGYYFDPGEAPQGHSSISMEYTSSNGCYVRIDKQIKNNFSPDVSFTFTPACIPPEGGIVSFTNTTSGKYAVERWEWNFGDPDSETNFSSEESPDHLYTFSGEKQISLTAYTSKGCVSVKLHDTLLVNRPVADFVWLHDCFIKGEEISLLSRSVSNFSEIESLVWTIKSGSGGVLGVISSDSPDDTIRVPFISQDDYQIDLEVWNTEECRAEVTREISLRPTIKLSSSGYSEDFNGPGMEWKKGSADINSSWVLDEPDFTGFTPVPGDLAWFTDLPEDTGYLDRSWIESPCFDFSGSNRPVIQMDLMKSFIPGEDGAVVQYSEGSGEGWKTLGNIGEGTNWYNVSEIEKLPGDSHFGWGAAEDGPDKEWIAAKLPLKMFKGSTHVKFRIVLATGGSTSLGNQGFAFDNFSIFELKRMSVLEHFTNSAQEASKSADDVVDAFFAKHSDQVIDLQYHMDYPGFDRMNDNNSYPPLARSRYYGVPSVPYALINGRNEPEFRFDFSSPEEQPDDEVLQLAAQDAPQFSMDMYVDWKEQGLEVTVNTICDADTFVSNIQLYMVVLESSVTAYTGLNNDTLFRNVVLDMLPTPAGKLLGGDWFRGDVVTQSFTWDYPEYVEDLEDLVVVAYVLNRENREILQAVVNYLTPPVNILNREKILAKLSLYPNPASRVLNVNLGKRAIREGYLEIMDLSGRVVMRSKVFPGYGIYQLQVSTLPRGIYMVCWFEGGVLKGSNKLIRVR